MFYGKKFPIIYKMIPSELEIFTAPHPFKSLCLDFLPETIEIISLQKSFNGSNKINIYINRIYPNLKTIIIDRKNINNIIEFEKYIYANNITLCCVNDNERMIETFF